MLQIEVSKSQKIVEFSKISIKIKNCKTFCQAQTASRLKEIIQSCKLSIIFVRIMQFHITSRLKHSQFSLQNVDKQLTQTPTSRQIYLTEMKISPKISLQQTVAKSYTHYISEHFDLKITLFLNRLIPSIQLATLTLYP